MKRLFFLLGMMAGVFSIFALDKPQYPGGMKALTEYISANLQYPPIAREMGIEGVVEVGFTVNPDGSLTNLKITHPVDPDLEGEAKRLVKNMPSWIPADKDGVAVEAPATVSVDFILP